MSPRLAIPGNLAAIRGGFFLIVQQIFSRLLTFIAGQVLLRYLTASKLGLATQLEVYYLTIVFFARESLRIAVQRQPVSSDAKTPEETARLRQQTQTAINLGYLAAPLGLIVSVVFGTLFLTVSTTAAYVPLATKLYALAALIELCAEPFFALLVARQSYGTRVAAESAGALARCFGTLGTAAWADRSGLDSGVLPFAAGQLAYGVVLWVVYVWNVIPLARQEGFSVVPKSIKGDDYMAGYLYRPTMRLAASMQAQGLVKHFLTQGDTLIVSILASPTAQGVYALANNYGGLVARLLFQPVEEMSRNYFALLTAREVNPSKEEEPEFRKEAITTASENLTLMLRIFTLFSTIVISVGPTAAPSLIKILAGTRWAAEGAGDVLGKYCYYIPLLALNGLTEAFVAASATEAEVRRQSVWMTAFSAVFAAAAYLFMQVWELEAEGLVYANIVNMACRIAWSSSFIGRFFEKEGVEFDIMVLMPGFWATIICIIGPRIITRTVDILLPQGGAALPTLIAVAASALPIVGAILTIERKFVKDLIIMVEDW